MYLKALEIQGFKSFPDRTTLTFEKNITAIVGPNGSGKSNISDALLWVMGEQRSKALRGGRMEDVIFGGTEKRSPLGFAQVSLILDNSAGLFDVDTPEVVITRRYYRSGESEYYLNRETVRLKDITELLMDTGLGRDGYSVIGQGRIAEIVSARSTDRREVFEEAAGISRYRYRKEEAERKLERTEENLLRVNDKIDELEMQVGPLEKQAETAKRFLVLRDEQRTLEISAWMETLDRLHAQSETVIAEHDKAKADLSSAQADLEKLYADGEEFTQMMRACDVETESVREALSAAESNAADCEAMAAVLRTNLDNDRENLDRLRSEMDEQSGREEAIRSQAEDGEKRVEEIRLLLAKNTLETQEVRQEAERRAAEADDAQQGLASLVAKESALGEALARLTATLTMLHDRKEELTERQNGMKADIAAANEKHRELSDALHAAIREQEDAKERADGIGNIISGYKLRIGSREREVQELTEKRNALIVEQRSTENRVRLLDEMEKEYEGMGKAAKNVMQAFSRGTLRGIYGPVGSLITVDDRYAVAVETALGASMQHIVVDTRNTGKAAIEMLNRSDGGRTTFLPLDTIRPNRLQNVPKNEPGYVGIAVSLIRFDERFNDVMSYLLGRTVVAETLADAIRMSEKHAHSLRIVTLDGQMINVGGSMTGGSAARSVGILSRANELKRLRVRLAELDRELKGSTEQLAEAERVLSGARYEAETAAAEMNEAGEALHKAESAVSQYRVMLSALEENQEELEREKELLGSALKENDERISGTQEEKKRSEEQLQTLKAEIARTSEDNEGFDALREKLGEKLSALREQAASLEAERQTASRSAAGLRLLLETLSGDSEQRRRSMDTLKERMAQAEASLTEVGGRIAALRQQAEERRSELAGIGTRKMELEGRRSRNDRLAQEKNREILSMQSVCSRYEQKRLSAEMEEKQIVDKLWETYELSRTAAQSLRQPVESMSAVNRRIAELRRGISALGSVNLGAIDEYARVKERYDFLSAQRDDVEKAKRDLLKIISDITGEMKDIFLREFAAIDESFRSVFLELFGGGKASLALEDPEDPLGCGIEIRVQPPGKAVTTISLLSGGEKSFVAIALYFAIMKVRPTPFCVMDEIDAALDETNLERYASYMRKMTDATQFIVITHHRATMEEADVLYGVTMQEKGVTTVLNVDLDEAERTIESD